MKMRTIMCLLIVMTLIVVVVSEAILQVNYHTNTGIQVMTKLLSQSDLGSAHIVGGVAGIVNVGEKLIYSMKGHYWFFQ